VQSWHTRCFAREDDTTATAGTRIGQHLVRPPLHSRQAVSGRRLPAGHVSSSACHLRQPIDDEVRNVGEIDKSGLATLVLRRGDSASGHFLGKAWPRCPDGSAVLSSATGPLALRPAA